MRQPLHKLLALLCVVCLAACSDDDEKIPSLITDMAVVSIDSQGIMETLALDNGSTYDISWQQLTTDGQDTVLRCRAAYVLDAGRLEVYSLSRVYCASAYPAESFYVVVDGVSNQGIEYLPRDPVKVVSMWRSGGYLNLHLGLMTTGVGTHQYAFCQDSVGHYSLLHLRPSNDQESYTNDVYMSMPVPEDVDSLTFSVYTYDGIYTRTF